MKFERFIATFVMMNIVLMLIVVFSAKNEIFTETASQILFGEKVTPDFFTLSPKELERTGFIKGDTKFFDQQMSDIFEKTNTSRGELDNLKKLPAYERSKKIVQMFSLMGDGKCMTEAALPEKINRMADKEGCANDFALVFGMLARYTGLEVRIVSNGFHEASEVFDGEKWIYIDPYFAMTAASKDGFMSYIQFAEAMVNDGWMRFEYFGGSEHCMSGKPIAEHPYFGDKQTFASVYLYNGDNFPEIVKTQRELSDKALFIRKSVPYKNSTPELVYTEVTHSSDSILRKYVKTGMAVIALIFAGTNIMLPIYYLAGLFRRLLLRNNAKS